MEKARLDCYFATLIKILKATTIKIILNELKSKNK